MEEQVEPVLLSLSCLALLSFLGSPKVRHLVTLWLPLEGSEVDRGLDRMRSCV